MPIQNLDSLICGAVVTFGLTKLVFRGLTDGGTHVKVFNLAGEEREIEVNIFKNLAELVPTAVFHHEWDDGDHCIKCGDSDWYAEPNCTVAEVPPKTIDLEGQVARLIELNNALADSLNELQHDMSNLNVKLETLLNRTSPATQIRYHDPNRCMVCGDTHHGSSGLPCPKMRATSYG